jgi:hypothetical protein
VKLSKAQREGREREREKERDREREHEKEKESAAFTIREAKKVLKNTSQGLRRPFPIPVLKTLLKVHPRKPTWNYQR